MNIQALPQTASRPAKERSHGRLHETAGKLDSISDWADSAHVGLQAMARNADDGLRALGHVSRSGATLRLLAQTAGGGEEAMRAAGRGSTAWNVLGKVGKYAGPAGIGFTGLMTGIEVAHALHQPAGERKKDVAGALGWGAGSLLGGAGGASLGAALGHAAGPWGMLALAVAGGVGGDMLGGDAGRWLGEKLATAGKPATQADSAG